MPLTATAQTSVGYADPYDVSNLLEYRLPDWSYRVWDASVGLDGGGFESRTGGLSRVSNSFKGNLGSDFSQTWESEQRFLRIGAGFSTSYSRYHNSGPLSESRGHQFDGSYDLDARLQHYLGDGPFSVLAGGYSGRAYREDIRADRQMDDWFDHCSSELTARGFRSGM